MSPGVLPFMTQPFFIFTFFLYLIYIQLGQGLHRNDLAQNTVTPDTEKLQSKEVSYCMVRMQNAEIP